MYNVLYISCTKLQTKHYIVRRMSRAFNDAVMLIVRHRKHQIICLLYTYHTKYIGKKGLGIMLITAKHALYYNIYMAVFIDYRHTYYTRHAHI
jgi:hypothetical protein